MIYVGTGIRSVNFTGHLPLHSSEWKIGHTLMYLPDSKTVLVCLMDNFTTRWMKCTVP